MSWKRRSAALERIESKDTSSREKDSLSKLGNLSDVPKFSFKNTSHVARVIRVIDGDTIEVAMIHSGSPQAFHVRMLGIDTPETKPLKSNPDRDAIKREALAARDALTRFLPTGSYCRLDCGPFCKFGRILATVFAEKDGKTFNVNAEMVEQGFAIGDADSRTEWSVLWDALQRQRALYASKPKKEFLKISPPSLEATTTRHCRFFFCF